MARISKRRRQRAGWLHRMDVVAKLKKKYDKRHHRRIAQGVEWVAAYWLKEDGNAEEFAKFCEEYFVIDPAELDKLMNKIADAFEQIFGMGLEIYRTLHNPLHLDTGPISKWDKLFVRFDPFSALHGCLYESKVAFVILLNFAAYTTAELLVMEDRLTRRNWLECRLTDSVRYRMKQMLERRVNDAYADAEEYISEYNIYSSALVGLDGQPIFDEHKKLLSHWGLRDEIRAQYFQPDGLQRQETLYAAMKRIVMQEVPNAVINNPDVFWDPARNHIFDVESGIWAKCNDAEPNTRYSHLKRVFLAEKSTDIYYGRDFIDRSFMDSCEIPEQIVETLLVQILSSPLAKDVAKVIRKQVGRRLKPFDIWFNHFVRYDEKHLDPIVKSKYPNPHAFHQDVPNILMRLGFDQGIARLVADNIQVDACRGSGHAWGALRRQDKVLLRTRFRNDGMDFQGFEIGMHELGHCAEMVLCLHLVDNTILEGLPNIGFSEAFAFLFERQKLEALGLKPAKHNEQRMILYSFWDAFEIAGVALLDIYIWKWLYKHRDAKPEKINQAIRDLAKSIWNQYFAPVIGTGSEDEYILAIYSHIIGYGLYMPNYAVGQIVTFQVLNHCRDEHWPTEMERMCKIGALTPNAWLMQAVGSDMSLEPMFRLTKEALTKLR